MLENLVLLIAVILILARLCFFRSGSRQDDRRLLVLAFIMLVAFLGLRYAELEYGMDLYIYYHTYIEAIDSDNLFLFLESHNGLETGYMAINWLLARIIKWPQFILFFEAAFCCGIVFRFIYKYSEDVLLSVLGFMSLGIMGFFQTGFRQSMAISVCLLALEMAEKKKWILFFLLVFIAMSLHQSAVIFLPVYFIMQIKIDRLFAIAETVLILAVSPLIPFIISLGNEVFEREYNEIYAGSMLGGIINIAIGAFVVFIMVYQLGGAGIGVRAGENCRMSVGHKFLYIAILGIGLYILRYQALVMERISFYFTPVIFVLMPGAIQSTFPEREARLVKMVFVLGMLFLIYTRFGNSVYVPFWDGAAV